jgi:hypothetical protein
MAANRFYEVVKFPYVGCWSLTLVDESPRGDTEYSLKIGQRLEDVPRSLDLAVFGHGKPMDFSVTHMGIPVVSERAANLLREVAPDDVQLISARIEGVTDPYWVVNIISFLDCIDHERSGVVPVEGPGGGFITAPDYVVDPKRVGDSQLFRLKEDYVKIIMAEKLKSEILSRGLIGPGLASLEPEPEEIMPGIAEV